MKWLYGFICLIFLIILHEFGHFLAAKIFGVKVEAFSVGFGPVLLHKKIKETDYRISLIPLGGYCKMKGEQDFVDAIEKNLPEISSEPDSLYGVHPLKRAVIGFAGPFFNFLIAFIFFSIINGISYSYYSYSNKIILADELYENSSTAARAGGILTGDIILKIDNKDIYNFSDIINEISIKPDEDVNITVDRDGTVLSFIVHTDLDKKQGVGKIGLAADTTSLIEEHTPKYNFFEAMYHGFLDCVNYIMITFKSFKILFKGVEISNTVSGPARVTDILGTTIQEGFKNSFVVGAISILNLLGIISLSLSIMNLLPIPVLDGGLILLAVIEAVFRKKIKPKILHYIQYIGFAFILFIFILGCIGDITYFIKK